MDPHGFSGASRRSVPYLFAPLHTMPDTPTLPALPADSDKRTYVLVAISGKLRWLPAVDDGDKPVHPARISGIVAARHS